MADIFDVLADGTRRELLTRLERHAGEVSVTELVTELGISQPTVSKHLKVLRDHGLVTVREEGQHRYYTLDSAPLEALEDWLIPFLSADFEGGADAAASTVFAAWSGVQMPEPLRRAAETLQHPADAGAAVGRAAAAASHEVERRVIDPIKKRLGRKDEK
jgi:ArsR family transcriptional regulator